MGFCSWKGWRSGLKAEGAVLPMCASKVRPRSCCWSLPKNKRSSDGEKARCVKLPLGSGGISPSNGSGSGLSSSRKVAREAKEEEEEEDKEKIETWLFTEPIASKEEDGEQEMLQMGRS